MIFMVLVGGLGTFEGPILGAVIFFAIEAWFGAIGRLVSGRARRGRAVFALLLPRGIWGWIEDRTRLRLLPVGYRLRFGARASAPKLTASNRNEAGRHDMLFGKTIVITGVSSGIGARDGELALALGADVIGVDINAPDAAARRLHRGGHRLGRRASPRSSQTLPQRFDALVQCRRRFRHARRGRRRSRSISMACGALSRSRRAAAARGRRHRQCRLDRRLRLARQSRARQGAGRRARLSRSRRDLAAHKVPTAKAYPVSKEPCSCGRCGPRISRCSRTAASGSMRSAPARWRRRS